MKLSKAIMTRTRLKSTFFKKSNRRKLKTLYAAAKIFFNFFEKPKKYFYGNINEKDVTNNKTL